MIKNNIEVKINILFDVYEYTILNEKDIKNYFNNLTFNELKINDSQYIEIDNELVKVHSYFNIYNDLIINVSYV